MLIIIVIIIIIKTLIIIILSVSSEEAFYKNRQLTKIQTVRYVSYRPLPPVPHILAVKQSRQSIHSYLRKKNCEKKPKLDLSLSKLFFFSILEPYNLIIIASTYLICSDMRNQLGRLKYPVKD